MPELWDVYDFERVKTGKTMERGGHFPAGAYHLVVHVCLFNQKDEMLIQQRQPFKEGWPDMWDVTVGGSAVMGDSSQSAAEREVFEEIGYPIDLSGVRPHFSLSLEEGFDDFYLMEVDVEISKLKLQYEEVQRVKWATKDEIISMLENDRFIPYHKSIIELCFDLRKKYSGLTK